MSKLASGTQTLADNSGKLTDGASQLSEGAAKLADGMSEISSGALELKDGCIKLNEEGVQKLAKLYKTDVKSIEKPKARRSLPTVCLRSLPEHWN